MKRNFLALAALTLVVVSCGEPGKAEYDVAAGKVCDCMSKNEAEAAADTSEIQIDMTDLNYSICVAEIMTDVDPLNEQMGKSIEEKCADLKPAHDTFVKTSK
jgi:hypothetical protein